MKIINRELAQAIVLGALRKALAVYAGVLIQQGWLSAEHYDKLLIGVAGAAVTFGWSALQKVGQKRTERDALALPAGSTFADLRTVKRRRRQRGLPMALFLVPFAVIGTLVLTGLARL